MLTKKSKNVAESQNYIIDTSFKITPVEEYIFGETEMRLQSLARYEFATKKLKSINKGSGIDDIMKEMGFDWEPLSEPGHMKQMPYAVVMTETIKGYIWLLAEKFCHSQQIPLSRISGGELFDTNASDLVRPLLHISRQPQLYGADRYNVSINEKEHFLRYSSCTQKLSITKRMPINRRDLPFGLFEISKSYRFEEENELQMCKRVRSFNLPELHIITEGVDSSLTVSIDLNTYIVQEISGFDPEFEIFCSITHDFFIKKFDFIKDIIRSIQKPILLTVFNEGVPGEDGVEINVDYKTFDATGAPVEIATFQVDDGTTDSAFDVKYTLSNGSRRPVSTIHTVFPFSSVERTAYFLLDRAIKDKNKSGYCELPFWAAPIQSRIIPFDKSCFKDAEKLAAKLDSLNFRVDLDDRRISYDAKKKERELKWIPYVITVDKHNNGLKKLRVESELGRIKNKILNFNSLIRKMKSEEYSNVIVPRYFPLRLSQRLIFQIR